MGHLFNDFEREKPVEWSHIEKIKGHARQLADTASAHSVVPCYRDAVSHAMPMQRTKLGA